jgi:hypothetical protein
MTRCGPKNNRGGRREAPGEPLAGVREKRGLRQLYKSMKMYQDVQNWKEADKIAAMVVKYEVPALQAVMSEVLVEHRDTLRALLESIDGSTRGISNGGSREPSVEIMPPLLLPGQKW